MKTIKWHFEIHQIHSADLFWRKGFHSTNWPGGNFFSDSLNILSLVFITFINPQFLGWPQQKWFWVSLDTSDYFFHLEYLNVLMYANWAGLIVNTNFDLGERALSMRSRVGASEASTALLLGLRSAPRQWIVSSQPAVLSSNKSPPSTKEMRNGRAFLEIPPANPCAPLEARRQQPSEEAHRGGEGGAQGGGGKGGQEGVHGTEQATLS